MRSSYLAAAIAMALPLPAAWAQTPTDTATLGEVIVTAQRRSENIQDVPVAVSTLSDEKLNILASGGDDVRFLAARLPSLNIESSFGRAFPRFYIRGLGNTDFDLNASQPVSLVYDDVVQENPILKGFPVFDLEMVEMFRGPQGTLFGRNTPAGVIKFNSVRPSRDGGGYVRASFGTHSSINVEGAVGGALGENWAMRVSGIYLHRDDWVDNVFTGEGDALEGFDEVAGRAPVPVRAGRPAFRARATCTRAASTAPRACSAPTSLSPAPTTSCLASTSTRWPSTAGTTRISTRLAGASGSPTTSIA